MDCFKRGSSFVAFDSQTTDSNAESSVDDGDLLSERGKEQFEELEWLDKDRNVVEDMRRAWNAHHMVRTQLGQHINRGRPPTPVLKRMLEGGSNEDIWPEARRWRREKRRYISRKDAALEEDHSEWVKRHLRDPSTTSLVTKDNETNSVHTDSPIFLRSSDQTDFPKAMKAPVRFCLFNTGRLSKREVWNVLKDRMTPETLDGVVRVQSIRQPNGYPRTDIWIEARVAAGLKKGLYMMANQRRFGVKENHKFPLYKLRTAWHPNEKTRHWRLDVWKSWRDRKPKKMLPTVELRRQPQSGLATLNINGMGAKKPLVENLLIESEIGILAIQETLLDENSYNFYVEGYEVYAREKKNGFRGQMLLIDRMYPSYEVSERKSDCFIHVKVAKFRGAKPWHLISIYLPSGGSRRKERTECLREILEEYDMIMEKEPGAAVVILGDFNIKRRLLEKRLKTKKTGLTCLKVMGDGFTFHRKGTPWSDVDSILVSPKAEQELKPAETIQQWIDYSDHFPLVAKLMPEAETEEVPPRAPSYRFNVDLVKGHGKNIVHSNRWDILPVDQIETEEELNESAERFCSAINEEAMELGIKQQVLGGRMYLNRTLKKKVEKTSKARKAWEMARNCGSAMEDELLRQYKLLRISARKALKRRRAKLHEKEVKRVAKLYHDNEMRAFHRWESNMTKGKRVDTVRPVMDKQGNLLTEEQSIRDRIFEYYKDLKQDDPERISKNRDYWAGKCTKRLEQELPGINGTPRWREILLAIRSMALGTAPGHDGIPVEVYKAMLKEECHQLLRDQGTTVGDNIYVALPERDLPATPKTMMGKHLERIILGIWNVERQPEFWSRVTDKSLHKSGDPTDLKNYRGISLIVVAMKIVTSMMANRISEAMEGNNLLVKEQGGFRKGEEAIAQFVTLAEIARRRRLKGDKTYVVFIDLLKAFDKVMHEALMEKMDALGFRGKFLNLLRSIYQTSKACIRVGEETTGFYDMLVGTRQGCPLSPILFILFINDLMDYLPQGVRIPGVQDGKRCSALMFADDIAGLAEDPEQAQLFLDGIARWSAEWKMPVGVPKCGVMMVGGTEEEQEEFAQRVFTIEDKTIPIVRRYKYLGIWVTDKLGDSNHTDEMNHCKTLAGKVKTAVDLRRAFLRDTRYPLDLKLAVIQSKIVSLGVYGGEWVGMCQKRTNIIQTEVNKALRLVLGSPSNSHMHASRITSWELGVPTIEERMADLRARLWHKASRMKTWIATLVAEKNRLRTRGRSWSSQTACFIISSRNQRDPEIHQLYNEWFFKALEEEGKMKRLPDPEDDEDPETTQERDRQQVKLRITSRSFANASMNNIEAAKHYNTCLFGKSRKFIKAAAHIPSLNEGVIWLARIRTSAWWTSKRRRDFLRATGGNYDHLPENMCPICKNHFDEDKYEIHHILFDCPIWKKEREQWLKPHIDLLSSIVKRGRGRAPPRFELLVEAEITAAILGGSFNVEEYTSGHLADFPDWEGGQNPAEALLLFERGWGGRNEYYSPHMPVHSYVPVARFLGSVMPKHKARLFSEEGEKGTTIRYPDTTDEVESHNRCRRWVNELEDEDNLHDGDEDGLQRESLHYEPSRREFYQANALDKGMEQMFENASDCSTTSSMRKETGTGSDDMEL